MKNTYLNLEKKLSQNLQKWTPDLLRICMGIIYFWYGVLKVIKISPAEELAYRATHWIGIAHFVMYLGFWEVLTGLFLLIRPMLRWGLLLLFLQFPGTFLPLFLNPEDCFTVIPFGLTLEGQYIFKNLVFVSAGFFLVGRLHPRD